MALKVKLVLNFFPDLLKFMHLSFSLCIPFKFIPFCRSYATNAQLTLIQHMYNLNLKTELRSSKFKIFLRKTWILSPSWAMKSYFFRKSAIKFPKREMNREREKERVCTIWFSQKQRIWNVWDKIKINKIKYQSCLRLWS